ncbi:FAD-dependent oxidoreductase [Patescibacteria group bacterium]|nr:FAD-dependent oxidoreductase [Patescibacteria group bacterium]MBU1754718.1 FAD-dependent oxidoreductase [Patescibacteria group bacterium]
MRSEQAFDIIVLGAGSGGLNIASFMNTAGFRVLLVDKSEETIGGDCLNFGCVPSKALIHVARLVSEAKEAGRFGLNVTGAVDMSAVREYISSKIETIRQHENRQYFEKAGMTVVIGTAAFASRNSVVVNGNTYSAEKIVLATGSRPRQLSVPGIEQATVYTNESLFSIDTLPKNLLVVGGGPIGIELGQALSQLGSSVTFVVKESRILSREDVEVASVLQSKMEQEGCTFYFNANLQAIENGTVAVLETTSGTERVSFDAVLVAIGRELETKELNLDAANIKLDERGKIVVDKYLRTTNKNVLVCGDIAGQHQFTHAAELHAGVIIRNFFNPFKKKLRTDSLSWVTYTTPEIATFGLSETELKRRRTAYRVLEDSFEHDDRAIVDETTAGLAKLFVSPNGILLGGTMVAKNAGELIQELILAQSEGMNISALFNKTYPYPTASRINKRVVTQAYRNKLTPLVKKIFKLLY